MKHTSRKSKLLFVGAFPDPQRNIFGGNVSDCKALMKSRFPNEVDVITLDTTQLSNPAPALPIRAVFALKRFIKFLILFEKLKPENVLLFASSGFSLVEKGAMAWYAKLRRSRSLLFPRGGNTMLHAQKSPFLRSLIRFSFLGGHAVLCQGPSWKAFVRNELEISEKDLDAPIISNWAATDELLQIGRDRTFGTQKKVLRILFVGWLEESKGVRELLIACSELKDTFDFELHIAGEGHFSTQARSIVSDLGMKDRVTFLGWLKGNNLHEAYAKADLFVLPSWIEGLPNSMIEAMATKLPVIVSNVGNIPDYIHTGENGLLINPKDISALKNSIETLLSDDKKREQIAEAGYDFALKTWGVEHAVDKLLEVLHSSTHKN